jgi:hypothetical protein
VSILGKPPWKLAERVTLPIDPLIELRELAKEYEAFRSNPGSPQQSDEAAIEIADELAEKLLLALELPS